MRMLLSSSLQRAFNHSGSPPRPAAPIKVEVQVWGLLARRTTSATQQHAPMAVVVSVVLAHALVVPSAVLKGSCLVLVIE